MMTHRFIGRLLANAVAGVLLATAAALPVQAQDTGRIVGRIVDAQTGSGLPNVTVRVAGSAAATLSGVDGRYVINAVPAGAVSIEAQSIGYGTKIVTGLLVPGGGVVEQLISLDPAAVVMAAIEVTAAAERGSVNRSLEVQRTASGILNSIAAEQISRSPDGDAAAAVQRVSGVTVQDGRYVFVRGLGERYTTTSLNGSRIPSPEPERKMVPLDLFPTGLLQMITTSKTFTPNLQGDFSGAQVDIRTREYPLGREFTLSLSQGVNSAVTGYMLPMAPRAGGEWLAAATRPRQMPDIVRDTPRPQPGPQTNAMVNAMRNAWSVQERAAGPARHWGCLARRQRRRPRPHHRLPVLRHLLAGRRGERRLGPREPGRRPLRGHGRPAERAAGRAAQPQHHVRHAQPHLAQQQLQPDGGQRGATRARLLREPRHEHPDRAAALRRADGPLEPAAGAASAHGRAHRLDWSVSSSAVSRQEPDRSEFVTWLDPEVPTWYNQEGAFRAYGGLTESSVEGRPTTGSTSATRVTRCASAGCTAHRARRVRQRLRDPQPRVDADGSALAAEPESSSTAASRNGETLFELGIFNAGGGYGAEDRLVAGYAMVEWALCPAAADRRRARRAVSAVGLVRGRARQPAPGGTRYTDVLPAAALNIDLTGRRSSGSRRRRRWRGPSTARSRRSATAPASARSSAAATRTCGAR
jgi:hypothetical protein